MECLFRICRVLLLACIAGAAVAAAPDWQGRPVAELLDSFSEQGYGIIYSSDVVTADMLVSGEPDFADPMAGLAAVLAAHGLNLEKGPAGTWLVQDARESAVTKSAAPKPAAIPLPEVIVTSSLHRLEYTETGTQTYLDRELATRIPVAAEEAVRITSRVLGTAGGGISTRNYVRGGEANEVLVSLDGLRLYEPFHLKDFQSVATIINSAAIDGIDFYTGAYPARYGDRMSGVINMSLRRPRKDVETEVSLSFFNTSVLSIGRFGGADKGDWLFAARRGNLDLIADVVDPDVGSPDYQDYLLHVGWVFNPRFQLSANILYSYDKLTINDILRGEFTNARYENKVAWLKWEADWSDVLRSTTIFSSSDINDQRNGTLNLVDTISGRLDDMRKIDAFGLQQDWVYTRKKSWMLRFGLEGKHQDARYDFSSTRTIAAPFDTLFDNQAMELRSVAASPEGNQYSAYAELRWQPWSDLVVDAGLRWDHQRYTTARGDEQSSPRLGILYRPSDLTELRLGWGQFSQAQEINELQASDGIDEFFPAQRAEHLVANLKRQFGRDVYLDVSLYRKRFRNLRPRYENAFNSLSLLPELQFDRYRIDPLSAVGRGAEFRVSEGDGGEELFWWLGYAWSEVRDRLATGKTPRSWDQTHAVKAGVSLRWGKWNLSAAGEYHSGWPKTELVSATSVNPDGTTDLQVAATRPNSGRYFAFHTLDVRASRHFSGRLGELIVSLEVSNLYNRRNPCCTEYSLQNGVDGLRLVERDANWLPLVPSLGVVWRF